MKKIVLVLVLSLLFILPGCSSSSNSCTFNWLTPGGTYLLFFTTSNGVPMTLTRVASQSGSITVGTYGASCFSVAVIPVINSNFVLTANPSSINLLAPPATVTITGQGFDTTYGIPRVEYFNSDGYLVGSVYATSVSSDGTSLVAAVPNLSGVYSGTYQIRVTNVTYQGYYAHIVGSATITAEGRDRPDSDGDGWYDDQDCAPYDPFRNYDCNCGNQYGGWGIGQPYQEICPYY